MTDDEIVEIDEDFTEKTEAFRALVDALYPTQAECARECRTTPQMVNAYYRGRAKPPNILILYLEARAEIERLKDRMAAADRLAGAVRELAGPPCDQ